MSATFSIPAPPVYTQWISADAHHLLLRPVQRIVNDLHGCDLSAGMFIVGGRPPPYTDASPIPLPAFGTPAAGTPVTKLMFCIAPMCVGLFNAQVNAGRFLEDVDTAGRIPGVSSRIVEGLGLLALPLMWPALFQGAEWPGYQYPKLQLASWEVRCSVQGDWQIYAGFDFSRRS